MLKLRLMLSQAISPEDTEDTEAMVMEGTDVDIMARGKLMLNLAMDMVVMAVHMEVMVDMDVEIMARGKLMLNLAMVAMDMVVMAVHMEAMVDMVIAVKFVPLFIIP